MARYHGRKGVVYLSTTGTGTAVNSGNLTKWSIQLPRDRADATCMNDANKRSVQGLPDVKIAMSFLFDDSATANLFTSAASTDGVKAYLYPSADAAGRFFACPAWLDVSNFNVDVNGAVTLDVTGVANGDLTVTMS